MPTRTRRPRNYVLPMTEKDLRIAIIGAGIGGFTLALALRQQGIHAEIYEAAPELTEIGAAVASVRQDATKVLRRLGLLGKQAIMLPIEKP